MNTTEKKFENRPLERRITQMGYWRGREIVCSFCYKKAKMEVVDSFGRSHHVLHCGNDACRQKAEKHITNIMSQ